MQGFLQPRPDKTQHDSRYTDRVGARALTAEEQR